MLNFSEFLRRYAERYPGSEVRREEPLSAHTTLRIGGPAELMLLPRDGEELAFALRLCRELELPGMVLGRGSNMLFGDDPIRMVVIKTDGLDRLTVEGNVLTAGAGVPLARCGSAALEAGLSGMECLHGIPGSAGGGAVMNAGAYGGEMKDVVSAVTVLNGDLETVRFPAEDCGFGYRTSVFSREGHVVTEVEFTLTPGDREEIREKMRDLAARRRDKQPLDVPSAGSTFKRPVGGYAAQLIDEAGLKGFRIGGAMVSEKHAGFVVNAGGATCENFLRVMDHVRETVLERSGIELEPEVRIVR